MLGGQFRFFRSQSGAAEKGLEGASSCVRGAVYEGAKVCSFRGSGLPFGSANVGQLFFPTVNRSCGTGAQGAAQNPQEKGTEI